MKTAREQAYVIFNELDKNCTLDTTGNWGEEPDSPEVKNLILDTIELGILRQMEEYRQVLLNEFKQQMSER